MCGIKSKVIFLVFSLVFLLSPVFSFSEVVLTDEEYQTLINLIETSTTELTEYKTELRELREQLMESQAILDRESRKLTTLNSDLEILRLNYRTLWKSYNEQKQDQILTNILFGVGGGLLGFSVNAIIGELNAN